MTQPPEMFIVAGPRAAARALCFRLDVLQIGSSMLMIALPN